MGATGVKSYKTLENQIRLDVDKLNLGIFKAWDQPFNSLIALKTFP